ncbi:hypothetical protein CR513_24308, partial [Mucuna pruriens]
MPWKRTMIMKDNREGETEEEFDSDSMSSLEDDNEEPPHDADLLVLRRVLNMQEKGKDEAQREDIFHIKCLVQEKIKKAFFSNQPILVLLYKEGVIFQDVFLNEVPRGLPPIRGIEHHIDLILGVALPNKPAYKSNPNETK